jgi:hypothetical protein
MLIHFQTRSRWGITISSPHHGVAEQPALAGACPFVSDSGDHSCFFSTNPPPHRYPKDPLEDTCPLRNGEQNQRRRNGFWKICRLLIRIRQMYPHHHTPVAHDEPLPLYAPPYYTSYVGAFTDAPIEELPATPELVELESPPPKSSDLPYVPGQMRSGYPDHEHFMSLEHNVSRTLERTDATRSPLSLDSHPTLDSFPSSTSGHQSYISSPVSSVALDNNIVCGVQVGSDGDFRKGPESSINTHSVSQHSQAEIDVIDIEQDNTWQNDHIAPATMYPMETSFASAGGSPSPHSGFRHDSHMEYTSWSYSGGLPMYDAGSTASPSVQSSAATALPQSHDAMSIPPGVYQLESDNVWRHYPLEGLERHNGKVVNRLAMRMSPSQSPSQAGQFDGQQQPSSTYAELHDHTYPEVVEDFAPSTHCDQCKKNLPWQILQYQHEATCPSDAQRHRCKDV